MKSLCAVVAAVAMPCAVHGAEFAQKGSNAIVGDVAFEYANEDDGGGKSDSTTTIEFSAAPTYFRFVTDGLALGFGVGAAVNNEQTEDTTTTATAGVVGAVVAYFHRMGKEMPVFGVAQLSGSHTFFGTVKETTSIPDRDAFEGDFSTYQVAFGLGVAYAGVGEWGPLVSLGIKAYHRQTEIDVPGKFKPVNTSQTGVALNTGLGIFF